MIDEFVKLVEDRGGYDYNPQLSIDNINIVKHTYTDVFRKELVKNCSNCYRDAIVEISVELKKRGVKFNIKMKKYRVKEYCCVQYKGANYSYNSKAFTDEIAREILREMPQYANCIEVIGGVDDESNNIVKTSINIDKPKKPSQPKKTSRPNKTGKTAKTDKTVKTEQVEQIEIEVDTNANQEADIDVIQN